MGTEKIIMKHNILDYAKNLTEKYIQHSDLKKRKLKGQIFTPKEVALFMAKLFNMNKSNIRLLDPGAGIGMLSVAFCSMLLNSSKKISLTVDTYENDPALIPYLKKALQECETEFKKKGHTLEYSVIQKDFILNNTGYLDKQTHFKAGKELAFYDCIISNPPYYKLNKNSTLSNAMKDFVSGQPNIYTFFMALSLRMLKQDGEMVFITPRSFCSGLYFRRFRKWLLEHSAVKNIHIFESRKEVFDKGEVLQENVIFKIVPSEKINNKKRVVVSSSRNRLLHDFQKQAVDLKDILHRRNGDVFIKIPSSPADIKIQHIINSWRDTLSDLGMKASTGPVVSFRAKEYLVPEYKNKRATAPLLWMHNIKEMNVLWPFEKKKRENAIKKEEKSQALLIPVNNYVLVKRFSSKEQTRRLYAGVLLKSKFDFDEVGIENHLNYIYKYKGTLSVKEAYGIAGILNTAFLDRFFRMMNGSTQVNAVDIMNLPLPSIEKIRRIGEFVRENKPAIGLELDKAVANILGIKNIC